MKGRVHLTTIAIGSVLRFAICLTAMLLLLSFPMTPAHRFSTHFRSPEVRRSLERHTFVASYDAHPDIEPSDINLAPTPEAQIEISVGVTLLRAFELPRPVSLARLLMRPKLGSSAGGQDPLS